MRIDAALKRIRILRKGNAAAVKGSVVMAGKIEGLTKIMSQLMTAHNDAGFLQRARDAIDYDNITANTKILMALDDSAEDHGLLLVNEGKCVDTAFLAAFFVETSGATTAMYLKSFIPEDDLRHNCVFPLSRLRWSPMDMVITKTTLMRARFATTTPAHSHAIEHWHHL